MGFSLDVGNGTKNQQYAIYNIIVKNWGSDGLVVTYVLFFVLWNILQVPSLN